MGLIDNIFEGLGIKELSEGKKCKITLIDNQAVYVEGVKSIKKYTVTEIILRLKNGGVVVKGEEMFIKKYCEGDMAICGKISLIERV